MEGIKQKILSKSDQYKFYKDNYYKLLNENKELKNERKELRNKSKKLQKANEKLEDENQQLKNENMKLTDDFDLIKPLVINDTPDSFELNYCPICGRASNFIPAGKISRKRAKCTNCNSLERHRLFFLALLKDYNDLISSNIKLLHFAPEISFYKKFNSMPNIDYYPVDINSERFEKKNTPVRDEVNIENIPYDNNTFEFIICAHVLEHVSDDIKAMSELYRVLKKDCICFISVPLSQKYETLENPEYNTPELRLKYYHQEDHVRLYGFDIQERLESVGFKVKKYTVKDLISNEKYKKIYGIGPGFTLFVCEK